MKKKTEINSGINFKAAPHGIPSGTCEAIREKKIRETTGDIFILNPGTNFKKL